MKKTAPRAAANANLFQELLEFIEDLSGVRTVIYDRKGFTARAGRPGIDVSFSGHRSGFCCLVRGTERGERACTASDVEEATREAGRRGAPFLHVCHAGLKEAVLPVVYRGEHVATVFCGQAAVDGCPASDPRWLRRRARRIGADADAVASAYGELPRVAEDRLVRIGNLVFLALGYLAEAEGRAGLDRTLGLDRHRPVKDAIAFVDERFREPVGVSDAAERCGLAPSYLSRLFRKVTGQTFSDFLTRRRIEHAKELLRTTSLDMSSVALQSGYAHQSYFGRKFRRVTGKTPIRYRSENRA